MSLKIGIGKLRVGAGLSGFPPIITDGTTKMRKVIRDGYLCTDLTLTPTGFAGAENTDWECVDRGNLFFLVEMLNTDIDTTSVNYASLTDASYLHGSIYYDGYIYATPRNIPATQYAYIVKVKASDYTDYTKIPIHYSSDIDGINITAFEQIQRVGHYLYFIGQQNVSGQSNNLLVQFDTRDDSYKIFRLTSAYGIFYSNPIACDDQYIYITPTNAVETKHYFLMPDEEWVEVTFEEYTASELPRGQKKIESEWNYYMSVLKYLASDFQSDEWPKYNTIGYDDNGVPVEPVDELTLTDPVLPGSEILSQVHAVAIDEQFIFISRPTDVLVGTETSESLFYKINKSPLSLVSTCSIPKCTDDIAQNGNYLFLGVEADDGYYGSEYGVIAVKKSNLAVTSLLKHSDEDADYTSYGVFLIGSSLIDSRTDKSVHIIDVSNPDIWDSINPSDPLITRLPVVFNDLNVHATINEIVIEDVNTFHGLTWDDPVEIVKLIRE